MDHVRLLTLEQTIVGISSRFVHRSSKVFDEPDRFNPDRWLGSNGVNLDKWLIAFSRGPRSCLGLKYASIIQILEYADVLLVSPGQSYI